MRLAHGRHAAYCPDVPRGGSWAETFEALSGQTLAVRDGVCRPGGRFGLGLQLGDRAAREFLVPRALARFRRWLQEERCEVFTVGDEADAHDWTRPERLAHVCRLLDLLGELLPEGLAGSISTAPGACQRTADPQRMEALVQAVYANLIHAAVHAAEVSGRTGRRLCLALEPEAAGLFGNTAEAIRFLEPLVETFPDQFGLCLRGFEETAGGLAALDGAEIPVVKMRLGPAGDGPPDALAWLAAGRSRCPHLEVSAGSVGACQRTLDLLAAHGLA